jgi:hypothetical protein
MDNMKECLDNGIISKYASNDNVWEEYNINVSDCDQVKMSKQPHVLTYDVVEQDYWPYKFKKVNLPDGWKFKMGCECGSNMNPSSFRLFDENGNVVKDLDYFPDNREELSKQAKENNLWHKMIKNKY